MPNLVPQDIREWMRRMEFRITDLTRRVSTLIPGAIADNVDLNGFMSTGRWRRPSTVGTTTALNYPFAGASGTLEVYWDPTNAQVQQVWYDRAGGIFTRWWNEIVWSAWQSASDPGLPNIASTTDSSLQTITSATLATLPSPVSATLSLTPGTYIIQASVSCMVGSGVAFAPSSSASLRYWLSGALTFQPNSTTAGVAGMSPPIATGGGTLTRNHQVVVTGSTSLTITAMAICHQGGGVGMRDITVQLTAIRRN